VCWAILVGSVAWWVAQRGLAFSAQEQPPSLMLFGPLVKDGEWWRVLMTVFEHSPNPLHILFNMSAVWTLGRVLEFGIGPYRMLITSVVGALGSAFFVLLFNFDQPTVGASGVILAWGGAILPIATQHGRRSIGMWLAQVAVISLIPGVSWAGHLGGFLFGLPCGFAMRAGTERFNTLAPVLLFVSAVLVFLVGSGTVTLERMVGM
jgi:rhomboid protease GluP